MPKVRIFQKEDFAINNTYTLNKRNYHYLSKVLRVENDFILIVFNGDGMDYLAKIVDINNKTLQIISKSINNTESKLNITLAQAIGKGDKMDFIVQKATELGVKKIIPLITQRTIYKSSNKDYKKVAKWQDIAISSSEQSGRARVVEVANITKIKNLELNDSSLFLDPQATTKLTNLEIKTNTTIIIGPEGGFSDEELDNSYQKISLGKRILRTETAAIACLANLELLFG